MGGFNLLGPTVLIRNLPRADGMRCKCPGFRGLIDAGAERHLVNRKPRVLVPAEIPGLEDAIGHAHLGGNMRYEVVGVSDEFRATASGGWWRRVDASPRRLEFVKL